MTDDGTLSLSQHGASSGSAPAYLVAVLSAEQPLSPSQRIDLANLDELVVGRGQGETRRTQASLAVLMPDRWMSTRHARLIREANAWLIEDCDSKNGVFLNGAPVERSPLEDGDVLELGHTFFVFRRAPGWEGASLDPPKTGALSSFNPSLMRTLGLLDRIAGSELPVLVRGETGTGKELMARAIHGLSRRKGPFMAVNCGALPPTLIESELFGFRRGAFSGAVEDRPGLVRAANGGTLFLDEIGELPASGQTALLRVLQEREVHPVGATKAVPVDIRVVAATHRHLDEAAERGGFRADLLARLSGFSVRLPPLRERREDLGLLVRSLLARLAPERAQIAFTHEAARALFRRAWSKNVRELERCLGAALVLAGDEPINVDQLFAASDGSSEKPAAASRPQITDERRGELIDLLRRHKGNVTHVARALGRSREVVHRWIKRYGLDPKEFRS